MLSLKTGGKAMGNRLRETRQNQKLTIRDLARLAGVSISTISRIETGESDPTLSMMCRLCKALHAKLDDVFYCD